MKRGHHSKKQTFKHTSPLLDQLGPEGRIGEKAKPTSVDSSSDKPKAPIRNVGSQPLNSNLSFNKRQQA